MGTIMPSITCPHCGRESFNPNDIEQKFCGVCGFHESFELQAKLPAEFPIEPRYPMAYADVRTSLIGLRRAFIANGMELPEEIAVSRDTFDMLIATAPRDALAEAPGVFDFDRQTKTITIAGIKIVTSMERLAMPNGRVWPL